jgi:hypothetical protein
MKRAGTKFAKGGVSTLVITNDPDLGRRMVVWTPVITNNPRESHTLSG